MSLSNPQFLMWYLLPTTGYYNPWYDSSTLRLRPRDALWSLCRTEVSVFMEITPCGHLCRQRSNPGETVFTTSAVVSWFLEKNLLLFHLAASTANTFPQFASGSDGNVWGCRMWTLSLSFLCLTCFGTGQFLQMPEFRVEIRVSFLLTEISSACFYSYISSVTQYVQSPHISPGVFHWPLKHIPFLPHWWNHSLLLGLNSPLLW